MQSLYSTFQISRTEARRFFKRYYSLVSIPKGYHVHHKDFNPLNNNLDNLELLTNSDHMKLHWKFRKQNKIYEKELIEQLGELNSMLVVGNIFGYHCLDIKDLPQL